LPPREGGDGDDGLEFHADLRGWAGRDALRAGGDEVASSLKIKRQAASFVKRDDDTFLAVWIEYEVSGRFRTKACVYENVRALLPRDDVGLGVKYESYDVSRDDFRHWLEARGYQVIETIAHDD
jgi:hypothetical protein